jgi:hypothetical protein
MSRKTEKRQGHKVLPHQTLQQKIVQRFFEKSYKLGCRKLDSRASRVKKKIIEENKDLIERKTIQTF